MYGLFQTIFYFGYSALGAIAIGIICGNLSIYVSIHLYIYIIISICPGHCGFIGARYFIRKIYTTVKID